MEEVAVDGLIEEFIAFLALCGTLIYDLFSTVWAAEVNIFDGSIVESDGFQVAYNLRPQIVSQFEFLCFICEFCE
jgi:hypothetical protein